MVGETTSPIMLLWSLTECRFPAFLFFPLQTVSVSVSVLTLSCIALDRWYAICHPLMFKSTAKRARNSILVIWMVSCFIMIPQAIVMECSSMFPGLANKTILFTVCDEHWGGECWWPQSWDVQDSVGRGWGWGKTAGGYQFNLI